MIQTAKLLAIKCILMVLEGITVFLENSISSIENLQAELRALESKHIVIRVYI